MTHKSPVDDAKPSNASAVKPTQGHPKDPPAPNEEARSFEAPTSRRINPDAHGEKPDHMAEREAQAEDRQEALLDEAIEETFPGSDPISPKHIT